MNAIEEVFTFYGNQTVERLRQSFRDNNVNASGRLSDSVESKVVQTGMNAASLQVSMFRYGLTSEDGRGPTVNNGPGQLLAKIRKWIDDKRLNIPQDQKISLAHAITKTIHREGTLQYRKTLQTGRGSGVISDVINDDLIDEIVSAVADEITQDVADGIASQFTNRGRNVSS